MNADQLPELEDSAFRKIFTQAMLPVIVLELEGDAPGSFRQLFANQAACDAIEFDMLADNGYTWDERNPDLISSPFAKLFMKTALTGERSEWEFEYGDSKYKESWTKGQAVNIGGRKIAVLFENIAKQKRAEFELQETQKRIYQAEKMQAIGRLVGGIAHDFNNLLTTIFLNGKFVLDELQDGTATKEDMQEVLKAADRAKELTTQLMSYTRSQNVTPQNIDLNQRLHRSHKMLQRLLREDIEFNLNLQELQGTVLIDPAALEQILVNIMINAADAMPGGGKLLIETSTEVLDKDYDSKRKSIHIPEGTYARISISDTGIGMDSATLEHAMEPFFSTKNMSAGSGLGLSTAYGLVKQARGFIWLYSEPGAGTTVKIYLPLDDSAIEQPANEESLAIGELSGTVVVAEDDPHIRRLIDRTLTSAGFTVYTAADGLHAYEVCKELKGDIDLIVSDAVMPKMDGKDFIRKVAEIHPDASVLFISGYTKNTIATQGVLRPDVALLEKPFTPAMLIEKIKTILHSKDHSAANFAKRGKLLLIDDDPEILVILEKQLGAAYEVISAKSANEALNLLENHTFEHVLSDLVMPEMDGVAFYKTLRERFPDAARNMKFLTGYPMTEALEKLDGLDVPIFRKSESFDLINKLAKSAAKA